MKTLLLALAFVPFSFYAQRETPRKPSPTRPAPTQKPRQEGRSPQTTTSTEGTPATRSSESLGAERAIFGIFAAVDIPFSQEMPDMSTSYGVGVSAAFRPSFKIPVLLEIKGTSGLYYLANREQTFTFSNNARTTTNVDAKSSLHKVLFGPKIMLGNEFGGIRGFVTPQIGGAFLVSEINVSDPADASGYQPVDPKMNHSSGTFVYGLEAGMSLNLSTVFPSVKNADRHRLQITAGFIRGASDVDYINPNGRNKGKNATDRTFGTSFWDPESGYTYENPYRISESTLQYMSFTIGYTYSL